MAASARWRGAGASTCSPPSAARGLRVRGRMCLLVGASAARAAEENAVEPARAGVAAAGRGAERGLEPAGLDQRSSVGRAHLIHAVAGAVLPPGHADDAAHSAVGGGDAHRLFCHVTSRDRKSTRLTPVT